MYLERRCRSGCDAKIAHLLRKARHGRACSARIAAGWCPVAPYATRRRRTDNPTPCQTGTVGIPTLPGGDRRPRRRPALVLPRRFVGLGDTPRYFGGRRTPKRSGEAEARWPGGTGPANFCLPRRTGTRSAAECSWPWKRSFCSSRQDKNGTVSCRGCRAVAAVGFAIAMAGETPAHRERPAREYKPGLVLSCGPRRRERYVGDSGGGGDGNDTGNGSPQTLSVFLLFGKVSGDR